MLGSISTGPVPIDDSGTRASPGAIAGAAIATHEPVAASLLLRDRGAGLVADELDGPDDLMAPDHLDAGDSDAVAFPAQPARLSAAEVAAQLAPIDSMEALASSYSREANPADPAVRAGYECAWAELGMRLAFGTTRRARHRATLAGPRRRPRS